MKTNPCPYALETAEDIFQAVLMRYRIILEYDYGTLSGEFHFGRIYIRLHTDRETIVWDWEEHQGYKEDSDDDHGIRYFSKYLDKEVLNNINHYLDFGYKVLRDYT